MLKLYIHAVAFISGGVILAVEILGTRILGPFYGVSLYLWSALISVTLAALAIGYVIGGRLADKNPSVTRMAGMLLPAGIWLLLLPWLSSPLFTLGDVLGLRVAVLLAALVLFGPPLTVLGTISPFAVRVLTDAVERVGRTAGNLWAVSTLGSVISALLTGFVLIPNFGVTFLTLALAAVLILTAAAGFFLFGKKRAAAGTVALLLLVPASAFFSASAKSGEAEELSILVQSPYGEIRVLDMYGYRYLLIDGGVHTMIEAGTGLNSLPYAAALELCHLFYSEPGSMLLLGLGGGSLARSFHDLGWDVDAVEIDPEVIAVAREHFFLRPHHARIHEADGRRFLMSDQRRYDLIVVDAFGSSSIPFHLVTQEAFRLLQSRLSKGGLLAINLESNGWFSPLVRSMSRTLSAVFTDVKALPIVEPRNATGNILLFARDGEISLSDERLPHPYDYLSDAYEHFRVVSMFHAWNNAYAPDMSGVPVLTDDVNPVDIWSEEIKLSARRELHEYFKGSPVGW